MSKQQERDFTADGRKTINIRLDDHLLLGNCVSQLLAVNKTKYRARIQLGVKWNNCAISSRRSTVARARKFRLRKLYSRQKCTTEIYLQNRTVSGRTMMCWRENPRTWQNSTLFRAHQHNAMARKECSNWTEIIEKRIFPSQILSNSIRGSLNSDLGEKLTILLLLLSQQWLYVRYLMEQQLKFEKIKL